MSTKKPDSNAPTEKPSIEGKTPAESEDEKSQHNEKRKETFLPYMAGLFRGGFGIPSDAMYAMNKYVTDIYDRIVSEGTPLVEMNDRNTIGSSEIQTQVRFTLPAELTKRLISKGDKEDPNAE